MVQTQPQDESDVKLLSDIRDYGWHVVGIAEDDEGPGYAFTVGMFQTHGAPEICIVGLDDVQVMMQLVNRSAELLAAGEEIDDWHASEEVIEGSPVVFRRVDAVNYPEYFGIACWYYEGTEFPVLQCFWPDVDGLFPWQITSSSATRQLDLSADSSWPFQTPMNTAVFVTRPVLEEDYPILCVSHDEEGDWQFLCGTTTEPEDCRIVGLDTMLGRWPELRAVADLPVGAAVRRDAADDKWELESN